MSLVLDSVSGEEMVEQDSLALKPHFEAQPQDIEREKYNEKQVVIPLEGAGAEPATGEQNRKAFKSIEH